MSYNPNIPASGTRIDQTFQLITTNFSQANTIFGANHVQFNDNVTADQGKHKNCVFPEIGQASNPGPNPPTTSANEGALYTNLNATSAESELIYRRENKNGAYVDFVKDIPISLLLPRSFANYAGGGSGGPLGFSYNANAVIRNSLGVYTISFTNALANANYCVSLSGQNTLSGVNDNIFSMRINTKTNTGFQVVITLRAGGSNQLIDPSTFSYVVFGGF